MAVFGANRAIDLGRDGVTLAIGLGKEVRLIAADTGKERVRFDAGHQRVENLALSPDGKRLATLGWPAEMSSVMCCSTVSRMALEFSALVTGSASAWRTLIQQR